MLQDPLRRFEVLDRSPFRDFEYHMMRRQTVTLQQQQRLAGENGRSFMILAVMLMNNLRPYDSPVKPSIAFSRASRSSA